MLDTDPQLQPSDLYNKFSIVIPYPMDLSWIDDTLQNAKKLQPVVEFRNDLAGYNTWLGKQVFQAPPEVQIWPAVRVEGVRRLRLLNDGALDLISHLQEIAG